MGAASSKAEDALDLSADVGCAAARTKLEKKSKELGKDISRATNFVLGGPPPDELPASLSSAPENPKNNILLMTDGYKFSHHKQYPVSWMPEHGRPKEDGIPPVLFPCSGQSIQDPQGVRVLRLAPVPGVGVLKLTIVTSVSTAVVAVEPVPEETEPDFIFSGSPKTYTGALKDEIIMELSKTLQVSLGLPANYGKVKFANVDESKLKRGSALNADYCGGYNVSYFTPRAYKDAFESCAEDGTGDHIVFFGLQYFIKEFLAGPVVTPKKIEEAEAFVSRYMADVRMAGDDYAKGFDFTMFPRGDWEAICSGDHDGTGFPVRELAGLLPIKIEALPEGSTLSPGVACFKLTNTHPRFFWLPNFLETLLVQVWYPTTVATQAREFRKTIMAYSVLSQRVSQMPDVLGPQEFTPPNLVDDGLAVHIAQVFDLLDFGYRGVSSHETASLGSAAYYAVGYEGSDTVAGSRMLLRHYNAPHEPTGFTFASMFETFHCSTSVPAAEHSTITSWADTSPDGDAAEYEAAEYNAFTNMVKQYMPSFCVSLVSDGFNIWNAVTNLWPSEDAPSGGQSMRAMLRERLANGQLTLIRPDSGEAIETLPQMLTVIQSVLSEHWQAELPQLKPLFEPSDPRAAKYAELIKSIQAKTGLKGGPEVNPFRRFANQQFRILQGDGVALDTVGDMLAALLAIGFCANAVHFGSGGGLLQKVNRDSLSCAFKCCAMYVGDKVFAIGKDPIAGGKKSYPGNPCVVRSADGVLRNRGEYDASGRMVRALPMSVEEFRTGLPDDELKTVFLNGQVVGEQTWLDIRGRAKVGSVDGAVSKALDNLAAKSTFFQRATEPAPMCVRLAEAACGSKWAHSHPTTLAAIKARFPQYASTFAKLGVTDSMSSVELVALLREKHVCSKKECKAVLAAIADGDPDAATAKMGGKAVLTL